MAFGFNGFASIASKLLRHDFQVVSSTQLSFPSARYPTCLGRTRRRTKQLDWRGLDLLSDCAVEMTTYSPRRSYNAGRDRIAKSLPPKRLRRACHESHSSGRSTVGPIHWILRIHLRSRSGETVRRDFASSGSTLRSHRPRQFVRLRPPAWCRRFDSASG